MVNLKVLDLFAGLGGATQAFRERGHHVVGVDWNPSLVSDPVGEDFDFPTAHDVTDLTPSELEEWGGPYDFVWASPPCTRFSKLVAGTYWDDGEPAHHEVFKHASYVAHALHLVHALEPDAWILENPAGMMRRLHLLAPFERRTVTYCQYGKDYRKETDLWGGFPPNLELEPPCSTGSGCHQASPRNEHGWGAETMRDDVPRLNGTEFEQTNNDAARSLVPYELSLEVCEAVEDMVEADLSHEDGKLTAHGVSL